MDPAECDAADLVISDPNLVVEGDRCRCEGVLFIDLPSGVVESLLGIGIGMIVRGICENRRGSRGRESSLEFGKRSAAREQKLIEAIDRGAERRQDALGCRAVGLLGSIKKGAEGAGAREGFEDRGRLVPGASDRGEPLAGCAIDIQLAAHLRRIAPGNRPRRPEFLEGDLETSQGAIEFSAFAPC